MKNVILFIIGISFIIYIRLILVRVPQNIYFFGSNSLIALCIIITLLYFI